MVLQSAPADLGPKAWRKPLTLRQSQRYCRRLARRHYENFTVAGRLLPGPLRQHLGNIYAYCRWADDLADEVGDPKRSLALLDWWETQLDDCYRSRTGMVQERGQAPRPDAFCGHLSRSSWEPVPVVEPCGRTRHPVFTALGDTIRQFQIPREPFADLLTAFRQDQRVTRYETFDSLLAYCRYSANPVGRLVLHLGRCCTSDRVALSDSICTGLQLTNFCQDVARDWQSGRIYLPQAACRQSGYSEEMFARRECNDAFRRLLAEQVDQAEGRLRFGVPLVAMMPPGLQLAVALFIRGGLATLEAIRRQQYDVWAQRPTLSRFEKLRLLADCWWKLRLCHEPILRRSREELRLL